MPDSIIQPDAMATVRYPNRSAEIGKLAEALAKAQGEIEGAVKDKNNPAFRSKYADLGAVWDAIRDPFSKNGLSVVQFPRRDGNSVEVETVLMHASGQWMSGSFSVPATKQDAHGFGSATTYARRFSLSAVCGVAPVDDDGNGAAGMAGDGTHFRPARRGGAVESDWAEEARKDGLIKNGETRSAYQVDKQKKAIDNGWKVVNTTPKGQEDQLFAYLDMARNPDDVSAICKANADLLLNAPYASEFEQGVDKLLRWFEKEASGGKAA